MIGKLGSIVVADDEDVLRVLYTDILGEVDGLLDRYEIVEEPTIALAKARYDRQEPVKLFVLDNDTKDGGILGLDFAEYLKCAKNDGVPVLMIAGFGEKSDYSLRAKALEAKPGFKYLGKPLDEPKIRQFLDYVKSSLKL